LECYIPDLDNQELLWSKRLSPGEKQRVSFVRALIQRPSFLFMDESTSAMDADLEESLMETLIAALPDSAIVSIAHRSSLEKYHDRIIVLEKT